MTSDHAPHLRLLDPIGVGGAGTVWRAWDRSDRRFVAVKIHAGHPARAGPALGLRHPHVLTTDIDPASGWVSMPLVTGGTVERLLAEHGALPDDFVAVLLDHLLDALSALHAAGLVHCDVKPANLLLEGSGTGRPHLWLADVDAATPVGQVVPAATNGYLAPEAARGASADPRQDLYAAGITATELLTGRPPPSSPRRGPLRPLLAALTDSDPDDRPPDAASARSVLRGVGIPEGAPWQHRPHPPVVPDRFSSRRRWRQRR
jgi:eukaryotic-like serine/threonine-protein kinase